ncbi:MAG: RluA family pseudouridine synthase [Rhodospirillaceae bacterium]|nr:RluA family pseudouridine synthase [Rhodospirillaceae bacterium]
MSGVQQIEVGRDEGDTRLDRWLKRRFPELTQGRIEKLLRTGQIRVDGARVKSSQRVEAGQTIRVPPLGGSVQPQAAAPQKKPAFVPSARDLAEIQKMVLYKDDDLIALNKPPGLAVQGGTKTERHIDGMLDGLKFDRDERPRLVHRLDRDTSGVLIVARSAKAATSLANLFRSRDMEKVYWALVIGHPEHEAGTISAKLAKTGSRGFERMEWDDEEGQTAVTDYRVVATAARKISWLELMPQTGRTHQLRAHCKLIGTPIIGDGKYSITNPDPSQRTDLSDGLLSDIADRMCLHARSLSIPRAGRKVLTITAPLPKHMAEAFDDLGFDESEAG